MTSRPLSVLKTCSAWLGCLALLPLAVAAQPSATIKVGKETKRTHGTIVEMVNADTACNLVMKDEKGVEFTELADFELCEKEATLRGKRVALTYELQSVMAASCQGDPNCKKTDRVALVTQAKVIGGGPTPTSSAAKGGPQPAGQASFCTPLESVIFACRTGAKLVSICASGDASPSKGYLQYRFGKPDSGDPLELNIPEARKPPRQVATGENVPFAGGGGAWLRIKNGDHAYVVYTGVGRWGPKGESATKQGLVVEHKGKRIASLKCTSKEISELGPDWFEKFGVKSNNQDFDFPD